MQRAGKNRSGKRARNNRRKPTTPNKPEQPIVVQLPPAYLNAAKTIAPISSGNDVSPNNRIFPAVDSFTVKPIYARKYWPRRIYHNYSFWERRYFSHLIHLRDLLIKNMDTFVNIDYLYSEEFLNIFAKFIYDCSSTDVGEFEYDNVPLYNLYMINKAVES